MGRAKGFDFKIHLIGLQKCIQLELQKYASGWEQKLERWKTIPHSLYVPISLMGKPVEQKQRNQIPMNEGSKLVQGQLIAEVFLLCFLSKPEENKIMPVSE